MKEGTVQRISVDKFRRELKEHLVNMTDAEALDFWNNVIVKNAPDIALKVTIQKKLPTKKE